MLVRDKVKRDYYEILGVGRDAEGSTIKKAYRSLAMKYHPDRNPDDAEAAERMKEINEAYAVLSDTQKRRLYDTYGHAGLEGYTQADIFSGVDFSSLFREFGLRDFFGFGDSLFDSFFGRRTTTRRGPKKGADLRYDLTVTLEDVAFGAEKIMELPVVEQCSACSGSGAEAGGLEHCTSCQGTGQIVREQRSGYSVFRQITVCGKCRGQGKVVKRGCKECQGKGVIEKTKELKVAIPRGADTGYQIKLEGEGERSEGVPGDLYVVLHVEKHPVFERHGDDIYLQQDIAFTTAALGGTVEVAGLNGNLTLDIPAETQTGTTFRIDGEGMPRLNGYGKGDQYVMVKVVTPQDLTEREKELLRELDRLQKKKSRKRDE
jgi:molecular chaperone DnaJ